MRRSSARLANVANRPTTLEAAGAAGTSSASKSNPPPTIEEQRRKKAELLAELEKKPSEKEAQKQVMEHA